MVCEPMATKIDPWSHPSKGYVHPTHGARGNGYLVEMCCLPSCLEDTAPPETGRFARNDRKVIIAPPPIDRAIIGLLQSPGAGGV